MFRRLSALFVIEPTQEIMFPERAQPLRTNNKWWLSIARFFASALWDGSGCVGFSAFSVVIRSPIPLARSSSIAFVLGMSVVVAPIILAVDVSNTLTDSLTVSPNGVML